MRATELEEELWAIRKFPHRSRTCRDGQSGIYSFKRNAGCLCAGVSVRRSKLVAIGYNILSKCVAAQSELQEAKECEPYRQ